MGTLVTSMQGTVSQTSTTGQVIPQKGYNGQGTFHVILNSFVVKSWIGPTSDRKQTRLVQWYDADLETGTAAPLV